MAASLWWDEEPTASSSAVPSHSNKQQNEDLSVFGYSCKLFHDDERATAIDQGKLLIPWMGDDNLMIDRYDGRGHLYDLVAHDAANVVNKNPELSEEEKAVEKACDEERYLELYKDVQEEAMYEEEEWKRYYLALQEGYQAVGFSYDQQQRNAETESASDDKDPVEEEEKPFVAPEELNVPDDMIQPTCSKQHARIEKTASFIAKHGIQMEIMLKTRQSGNAQFNFLYFEDVLNPYYKNVVSMIKSGRYKPQATEEKEDKEDDYLHPSLSSTNQVPLPPLPPPQKPIELPKVAIHDTPYGALINSFKKYSAAASASPVNGSPQPEESDTTSVSNHNEDAPSGAPSEEKTNEIYAPAASTLYGPALEDQFRGQSHNPSSEKGKRKKRRRRTRSSSSDSSSSSSSSSSDSRSSRKRKKSESPLPRPRPRPEGPSAIIPPPADIQPIVDRMALYVAKNGIEFEMVVMGRNDPRFQFLNEYHAYFPYYRLKRELFLKELGRDLEQDLKKEDAKESSLVSVSFSIKAKSKESEPVPASKSKLFDYDTSEGEEGGHHQESVSETPSRTATPPTRAPGDEGSVNADEKVKDKLASALKERISQSSKEKNLQAERKRKAAMFLTMIKANQPQASPPSATAHEDAASLYVGEAPSSSAVVYEYDNQPMPHRVDRARSPRERRRHRKSPTPPSAYNLDRRSPGRPSPPRRQARGGQWSSGWERDRDYSWQRHYSDYGKSPPRREERKKKRNKRSRSRTPSKREKSNDKTRRPKEKSKRKSKDRDRDRSREKKKKSSQRNRSKEKETTKAKPLSTRVGRESSGSDVEMVEAPVESGAKRSSHGKFTNGDTEKQRSKNVDERHHPDAHEASIALPESSSSVLSGGSSALQSRLFSDSTDFFASRLPSGVGGNNSDTQESIPSQKTDVSPSLTPSSSSSDLRSKVRAMLKRSREIILKEESFSLEET